MNKRKITTGAITLIFAGSIAAQDSAPQGLIEELLVVGSDDGYRANESKSATRLNAPLEEIPVNLLVITKDLINDLELTSQRDALQFSSAVDDKRVRGFNTGEFFRNGFLHLSDTPGYAIERLEVLRGPTAVLNGPTTSGGAINVLTKQARLGSNFSEFGGYFGSSDSDRDNYGVNADLNFGSIFGEASYGSKGALRLVGGFQRDTGFNTDVDNDSYSLLPSLSLHPWENTYINLELYTYEIATDRTDRPMGAELFIPGPNGTEVTLAEAYGIDPRSTWFAPNTDIEESLDDFSISVQHIFNDNFIADLRYNNHQRDFIFGPGQRPRIDIFFGPVQTSGADGSTNPADFQVRRRSEFLSLTNDVDQFAADFSFLPGWGESIDDHTFTAGFSVYDQTQALTIRRPFVDNDADGTFESWLFEFFNPADIEADRANGRLAFNPDGRTLDIRTVLDRAEEITLDNIYLNYNGKWFNDKVSVVAGLTHSDIELARSQPPTSPANITSNSELLPQLGAVLFANEQVSFYANYSKSQLPDINDPDFGVARIRNSEQFEIGTRLEILDSRLGVNLGYYQIEQEISGTNFQTGESDGFDLDLFYFPTEQMEIIAGWSSNDTEVTASSNASQIGDPLVDEIPNKFALISKYNMDNGISFGGAFTWIDSRPRPTAAASTAVKKDANGNVLEYNSETRLDLFASYNSSLNDNYDFEVSLNLRNLTEDVNISNTVPRVPLQGGVDANGSPTAFSGDKEIMLRFKIMSK